MTTLTLTKHHGLGNDFLVVFEPDVDDLAELARRLCDRRRGIGADGLIVGDDGNEAVRMVLFNADGSRAEISGNGIRCFAQAVAMRRGRTPALLVLTDAGERVVEISPGDELTLIEAAVDMGAVDDLDEPEGWNTLQCDPLRPVRHLGLGNPHSVVAVDDIGAVDVRSLGRLVPHVNLEVIEAGPEPGAITMRVHERGAGVTEACGSGACASAWAAEQWGMVPPGTTEIVVHMDGGDAKVRLHKPAHGRVTLVGPAQFVGTVTVDV